MHHYILIDLSDHTVWGETDAGSVADAIGQIVDGLGESGATWAESRPPRLLQAYLAPVGWVCSAATEADLVAHIQATCVPVDR